MDHECAVKKSLTLMVADAKQLYSVAIDELNRVGGTEDDEYQRLLLVVKQRREMAAEAQGLLDEHIRSHKC